MTIALSILLILFYLQAVTKFLIWLLVPYHTRIRRIASYYARGQRVIRLYDNVTLLLVIVMVALLVVSGAQSTSFATGLLVGMLLVQTFFHRFDQPLPDDRMPPSPVRPNQHASYAIQTNPWLGWREIAVITILSGWALYVLVTQHLLG